MTSQLLRSDRGMEAVDKQLATPCKARTGHAAGSDVTSVQCVPYSTDDGVKCVAYRPISHRSRHKPLHRGKVVCGARHPTISYTLMST